MIRALAILLSLLCASAWAQGVAGNGGTGIAPGQGVAGNNGSGIAGNNGSGIAGNNGSGIAGNTSASTAPYSTWDSTVNGGGNITYSASDTVASFTGTGGAQYGAVGSAYVGTGKVYFETTITYSGGPCCFIVGLVNAAGAPTTGNQGVGENNINSITYNPAATTFRTGTTSNTFVTSATGTVLAYAIDFTNNNLWVRSGCAGNWNNDGTADPTTNTNGWSIAVSGTYAGGALAAYAANGFSTTPAITLNTGGSAFACTPPSGFSAFH